MKTLLRSACDRGGDNIKRVSNIVFFIVSCLRKSSTTNTDESRFSREWPMVVYTFSFFVRLVRTSEGVKKKEGTNRQISE